jgi:hypothetical protein
MREGSLLEVVGGEVKHLQFSAKVPPGRSELSADGEVEHSSSARTTKCVLRCSTARDLGRVQIELLMLGHIWRGRRTVPEQGGG